MVEPFIFVQTGPIKDGMLDSYTKDIAETAELVETEEPRVLHFASYINEEGTEQTVLQIHPDPESMRYHMQVARRHIEERGPRNLDLSRMRIDVYGTPTEPVLALMRELAESGVPIRIKTLAAGFNRLPEL
jgi:hypothetical protein